MLRSYLRYKKKKKLDVWSVIERYLFEIQRFVKFIEIYRVIEKYL